MNYKVSSLDTKLKMDQKRTKVFNLKQQIEEFETKKDDLEIRCNEANMPIPELRERLLEKMKEDGKKIQEIESRTRELRRAVNQMRRRLRDLEDEINGTSTITEENKQKYEAIYKKEQAIDKFMAKYPQMRETEINNIEKKSQDVLLILEKISQMVQFLSRDPS